MGHNDESEILTGIVNGDLEILKHFYKKNFIRVQGLITRNMGNEADSEDIFHEALIILYQKIKTESFIINCSIDTFFYGICKNLWRNRVRKKNKLSCCDTIDDLKLAMENDHSDAIDKKEREGLYRKHFLNLNCKCRQLLTLFFEGKSMIEIAAIESYSEGYARKKSFECKAHLLKMIEQDPMYSELRFTPAESSIDTLSS